LFFGMAVRIKAAEVRAGLDQSGDAARQPVTLRMAFAQFRREQIRQLYLAYLTLNLSIGHRGVEVMLKPRLRQQLDEQLLRKIGISAGGTFFEQQTGAP